MVEEDLKRSKLERYLNEVDRISRYLTISGELETILYKAECPEEVIELIDKALWVNITKDRLTRVFTLEEVIKLDDYVSNAYMPFGFYLPVAYQLRDELGIQFKSYSSYVNQKGEKRLNWENPFRN